MAIDWLAGIYDNSYTPTFTSNEADVLKSIMDNWDKVGLTNQTDPSSNRFGMNDYLLGAGILGRIGTGLFNAYNAYQYNQLARDQYNFQKRLANRNVQNQAKIINNTYDASANISAGMEGGTPADVERYRNVARNKYVNGGNI